MVFNIIMIISIASLTACTPQQNWEWKDNYWNGIKWKLWWYWPFYQWKVVSNDLDNLIAELSLEIDGESASLEVKDNKTNEVLWSNIWNESVDSETFTISLKNLKKENEYVVCFTGTKINNAKINITFDSDLVQEREKPLK